MTRHSPPGARRRTRNLLYAVLGLTLTGIAWIAMAWIMQRFQHTNPFLGRVSDTTSGKMLLQ
jgi:hypothetical protein